MHSYVRVMRVNKCWSVHRRDRNRILPHVFVKRDVVELTMQFLKLLGNASLRLRIYDEQ